MRAKLEAELRKIEGQIIGLKRYHVRKFSRANQPTPPSIMQRLDELRDAASAIRAKLVMENPDEAANSRRRP